MKGLVRFVTILLCSNLILATSEDNTQNVIELVHDTSTVAEVKPETLENSLRSNCFYADVDEFCFKKEKTSNCECFESSLDPTSIVCCNVTDIVKSMQCMRSNVSAYEKIHIINARQREVDVSALTQLKTMQSLAITDGNITKITGQFAKFSAQVCLNFSNNNISEISDRALSNLNLKLLDLSSNNLTKLPSTKGQTFIDIRKNPKIACRNISSALERGIEFLYKNISECEFYVHYQWFNSTASVQLLNLENVKKITNCPVNCICEDDGMIFPGGDESKAVVVVKVDCSNLMLTKLPEKLPENSYTLIISNNSITSLAPIANNGYYDNIRALYADDNQITSIEDLGKKFLKNFTILSLRNNKFRYMPYYILSNLEKNSNGILVFFGGNKIYCECSTAKNQRVIFCNISNFYN